MIEGLGVVAPVTVIHAEALDDPPRLRQILGDKKYWFDRERPDRELG
ncbi:hypothetical protein [Sphingopyxis sp. L1A2A]|nr:hypothetical protein [Sphingopyxis sp. L1A2A]